MSERTCTGGDSNGGSSYNGAEKAVGPLHHREKCITSTFCKSFTTYQGKGMGEGAAGEWVGREM